VSSKSEKFPVVFAFFFNLRDEFSWLGLFASDVVTCE
jgi:hypothetical protein